MTDVVYKSPAAAAAIEAQYRQVLAQWPVPSTERFVPTRQGSTFVLASGPDDAPPVLLLHGSQANAAAWMPDVPLWAKRFRLFAVDMIGEPGLSARVQPELVGEAHALWLDDVLAGLGLTQVAMVGTSLGGWLALDYASWRPGAVSALALVCPAGIGRQKNFLLKALPLLLLGPWGAYRMREMIFGPAPATTPAELKPFAELMEAIGRAVRPRTLDIPRLSDDQLGQLQLPLLAIVGGRDALLDSRDTRRRLQQFVPQAEIAFIDDGYHYLPGQAPRIMDFLERSLLVRPA